MRPFTLLGLLALCAQLALAQPQSQQALYVTFDGGWVLSYDHRFGSNLSAQVGAGVSNFDHAGSTMFRGGISYLGGMEHMFEVTLAIDAWTKILNPPAEEGLHTTLFVGYRYQANGMIFRAGYNASNIDNIFYESGWRYHAVLLSVGYSF